MGELSIVEVGRATTIDSAFFGDLKRRQLHIAEIPAIVIHVVNLALQCFEYGMREVDFFEFLRAAQSAGAEDIDLH
jgi:hypothetical protein